MRMLAVLLVLAPLAASAAPDAKALYMENCASCHGEKGDADTELGAKYMAEDFTGTEFKKEFAGKLEKVKAVINEGRKNTKMKAWKGILKPEEIDALAKYVLAFPEKKS